MKFVEERNEQVVEEVKEVKEAQTEEAVTTENSEETVVEEKSEAALLQERVDELQAKLTETEGRTLRLQADFENYKRRVQLDKQAAEKYRSQSLVSDILPALDNFERAMQVEANDEQMKSLLQGMDMVYRQLLEALTKEGVEAIEAVGKPFDPHEHQAVMQVEDSAFESNAVVEEFQKGYKLKDRVIRPSMVKVNQ
ncbi:MULTISPECIES: nucleotide exchange factor GrpE [unclassified Bacillus (in: firmicutes)]|uniref:nucleotide exchange factor GrpE n=1 Tax=unclassified Bacillus (in: firmicutes) TaxID=185979 RepID=UPI0033659777